MLKKIVHLSIVLFVLILFTGMPKASQAAARATVSFSPSSGAYQVGKPFSVNLVLNGNGNSFNATSAVIFMPPQLQINNLVLGDCNFAFITTPTITNPSFVGVILGGSTSKCTVYTLTLSAQTTGIYSVSLKTASMKQAGTAIELFGTAQNGTYTISNSINPLSSIFASKEAPAAIPVQIKPAQSSQNNLKSYSLDVSVLSESNQPLSGAVVSLDQSTVLTQTIGHSGSVDFSHISSGVHVITVTYKGKQVKKEIINVTGSNPVLTLGIQEQKQANSPQLGLIATAIFLVLVILLVLYKIFVLNRRKQQ